MQIISFGLETICIRCQNLFSGKNKKNISLSSAVFTERMVKVKLVGKRIKGTLAYLNANSERL